MKKLYTIGYANYTLDVFIDTIKKYEINAIADVRSKPFSSYKPEFNQSSLKSALKSQNIEYVFLGYECGARNGDPSCAIDGKVDFYLVSKSNVFQHGLTRIKRGLKKYKIALMCAEKDPISCHRMILICKNLKDEAVEISHILDANNVESQDESEKRLLESFKMDQPELFLSEQELLQLAYKKQSERIALNNDDE